MVLLRYSTLVFFLFFANSPIFAQENWEIVISDNNVIAEKNGEITHGDKLRFILSGGNCEVLEHVFTFYTVANNPEVENLESRILNPANSDHRIMLGDQFLIFRSKLKARQSKLSELYCHEMQELLKNPGSKFLPNFNPDEEADDLMEEVQNLLEPLNNLPAPPQTLYLKTWTSVFSRFSLKKAGGC